MKNYLLIVCFVTALASCKKNDTVAIPNGAYHDANGTWVSLTTSNWYLTRNTMGGGNVDLKTAGSTNADKVTIRTSGDGVVGDYALNMDAQKNFTSDMTISFTATSVPTGSFTSSTKMIAYRGTDTLVITLNSGALQY